MVKKTKTMSATIKEGKKFIAKPRAARTSTIQATIASKNDGFKKRKPVKKAAKPVAKKAKAVKKTTKAATKAKPAKKAAKPAKKKASKPITSKRIRIPV
jgi:hypothetical protein